jgi:hypothetical protein
MTNSFDDISCSEGAPYFYKVACMVGDRKYIKNNYFTFGIRYSYIDYFEPRNNDIADMTNDISSEFNDNDPLVIYSVSDGLGNIIKDVDFYKYRGPADRTVYASITLPNVTPLDGKLTFRWYYNGKYKEASTVYKDRTYTFSFDPDTTTGTMDLYCEIIINSSPGVNLIGTYNLEIGTGM